MDGAERVVDDSCEYFPLARGPCFVSVTQDNVFMCNGFGCNWPCNGRPVHEFHFAALDVQFY